MECRYCQGRCVKFGKQANGTQRYRCKLCNKTQQKNYTYRACDLKTSDLFLKCLKIGSSLRGIQYVTGIAVSTQLRWISAIGKSIQSPTKISLYDEYELDELCTYVGNKGRRRWVISAISKTTGKVVDIKVGTRTLSNVKVVVDKVLSLSPKAVFTDKLNIYASLIPKSVHKIRRRGINRIERYHLNLRTHIKRLNRRTICYTKNEQVLNHLVRIYNWA